MRFEELPGIPGRWLEFLQCGFPAFPVPGSIQDLAAHAGKLRGRAADPNLIRALSGRHAESPQLLESIRRISCPDTVTVIADLDAGLFGGPAAQILKCLTAIKICQQLTRHSVEAVPVAWLHPDASPELWSISLMDEEGEMHSLELASAGTIPESISGLLSQVADIGGGTFDPETLDLLRDSFLPGKSVPSATARLFSVLMRDWGMVVIDPAELSQTLSPTGALPALAVVVGMDEIDSLVRFWADFDGSNVPKPLAWPQASATVGDSRSRRTFDRYHLDLAQLFQGEKEVLDRIRGEQSRAGLAKLESLGLEIGQRISDLRSLIPAGREFLQAADSCREKVLYQIHKLRDLFDAALKSKEQTAKLRIRKACNLMAPNGQLQERGLAGIQIPLSYSLAGLHVLYEKLDILKSEHQLIWMD